MSDKTLSIESINTALDTAQIVHNAMQSIVKKDEFYKYFFHALVGVLEVHDKTMAGKLVAVAESLKI